MILSTVNSAPPSDGSKPFSTFHSLSTHIWCDASSLRSSPSSPTAGTASTHRSPRLTSGTSSRRYSGGPPQGRSSCTRHCFGAAMIQKAIASQYADTINKRIKQWEAVPEIFQLKDAGPMGSWPRFKAYEVDFGWGKTGG